MGSTHLQAYEQVEGAEIGAVVSSDEKKLAGDLSSISGNLDREGRAMDFGEAARYRTFEEALGDPSIDAFDICTPSWLHASQAVRALEAGKHVLVEKPMALSGEDCDRMLAAAERTGKTLMVAQVLRFLPDYVGAAELIRSGKLGAVRHAFFYRKCAAPEWGPWLRDKSRSGGGVFDLLIHDVDYCRYVLGKPAGVEATGVEELEKGVDVIEARFDYGDTLATVAGGWRHPKSYPFSMEFTIVCDGGTLDFRSGDRELTLYGADGEAQPVEVDRTDAFQAEAAAFVEACRTGRAPERCRPEESADSVKLALAMLRSRENGGARESF